MKKIFITGICGFVGSSLASFYYSKNYHVSGIDNLSRKGSYKNFLKLAILGHRMVRQIQRRYRRRGSGPVLPGPHAFHSGHIFATGEEGVPRLERDRRLPAYWQPL